MRRARAAAVGRYDAGHAGWSDTGPGPHDRPSEVARLGSSATHENVLTILRIDHVGIAVADLDAAIAFYRDNFGIESVHEEINEEQGVREAMLAVGDGTTRIQLLAPLNESSTIAKFLDRTAPACSSWPTPSTTSTRPRPSCAPAACGCCTTRPSGGTADSRVNFVHPKDAGGVLIELVEPAAAH